jgi:fibrillarin-like rRNA methylase
LADADVLEEGFNQENRGSRYFWNLDIRQQDYTEWQPRKSMLTATVVNISKLKFENIPNLNI